MLLHQCMFIMDVPTKLISCITCLYSVYIKLCSIVGWQRYMDMGGGGGGGHPSWDGRDTGDAMTGVVHPIL